MADWNKIKTEYITTDTSYRKLAQKYGVHYNAIANRAKQEGWVSQRNQFCDRTVTKAVDVIGEKQVDRAARLQSVADKLLNKIEEAVDRYAMEEIFVDRQSLRQITGALKDIKDIQMIRSEADIREQEAHIAKLRREAEREEDDKDKHVVVTIAGGDESWRK